MRRPPQLMISTLRRVTQSLAVTLFEPTSGRLARLIRASVIVALADLALNNGYQVVSYFQFRSRTQWPDFLYFYSFARTELERGAARLYDPVAQAESVHSIASNAPFYEVVNPPPLAWLLTPLAVLPYPAALVLWTALIIGALVGSWYILSDGHDRIVLAGMWLGFLPAYILVVSAPLAPLVMLSLAACWKLIRTGRDVEAGVVLAITLLKPNLVVLVPCALLVAGYRRVFTWWLIAALVLIIACVASLGAQTADYIRETASFAANGYALRWSIVPIVGDGFRWLDAAILISGATLLLAWRLRHLGVGSTIAVGVAGSLLVNHHLTPGDLNLLLVPMWLVLATSKSITSKVGVGVLWVAGWLGLIFPFAALVAMAGIPLVVVATGDSWGARFGAFSRKGRRAVDVSAVLQPRPHHRQHGSGAASAHQTGGGGGQPVGAALNTIGGER